MHFEYLKPRSLEEAQSLKAETPDSRYIAGGTVILVRMRGGGERPRALISLRSLPELGRIATNGGASIGAMATLTDVLENRSVCSQFPVLAEAVRAMASAQIRNVATLGGNLCNASPAADGAPPLLVLGARVRVATPGGRREVPLQELFLGPGRTCLGPEDVLTAIVIEPPAVGARCAFLRKSRLGVDLALASVAVSLEFGADGETCRAARVAAGAVASTPLRLGEVEAVLAGRRLTPEVVARAQEVGREVISPISDLRASADYRRHITGVLVKRALSACLGWSSA